jgi:DNA-binding NtrC family response regulator
LTKEGYQVRSAPMGEAVMDIVKSEPFDLVIMDINMPGKDGLKVMRNIKKLDEEIEIIVLTSSVSVYNTIQALRHNGAFDFLSKPLKNLDEFTTTVKLALEKRKR